MEGGGEENADAPEDGPGQDCVPGKSKAAARGLIHEDTAVEEEDGHLGGRDEDGVGELDSVHDLDEVLNVWHGIC